MLSVDVTAVTVLFRLKRQRTPRGGVLCDLGQTVRNGLPGKFDFGKNWSPLNTNGINCLGSRSSACSMVGATWAVPTALLIRMGSGCLVGKALGMGNAPQDILMTELIMVDEVF